LNNSKLNYNFRLQTATNECVQWADVNDMIFNIIKTKEQIITFVKEPIQLPAIKVDGNPAEIVTSAKLLGVTISSDLIWNVHVNNLVSKAGKRLYLLSQLKHSGLSQNDLLDFYKSVIRSCLEYVCQAWHTSLPEYLHENLEKIQRRAFKIIFPDRTYEDSLTEMKIPTLKDRREILCKNFFTKMTNANSKLHKLLPPELPNHHSLRHCRKYPLPKWNTQRYKNSFVPWCLYNYQ